MRAYGIVRCGRPARSCLSPSDITTKLSKHYAIISSINDFRDIFRDRDISLASPIQLYVSRANRLEQFGKQICFKTVLFETLPIIF